VNKVFKNMGVFALWLAGLVIMAHLFIPHDHHSPESFGSREVSCPASGHESDNHSRFPGHCHALNDLASEKALIYTFFFNFRYVYFLREEIAPTNTSELYLHSYNILVLPEHLPVSHLLELSPFRAPPVLG
jgi:hypothetical protein